MGKSNPLFEKALASEGVSGHLAELARSIYMQESGGGKNTKTSNANAHGGMQIIPATFQSVADKGWDINNPEQNARAGIRYLKQLDKQSGGDPKLTAAGYYGGPGGLEKARKGIAVSDPRNPKAPNTLQYGEQVVARMGKEAAERTQVAAAPAMSQPSEINYVGLSPEQANQTVPVTPMPAEQVALGKASTVPIISNQAENAWSEFQQSLAQKQKDTAQSLATYGKGVPANPIQDVPGYQSFLPQLQAQQARTDVDFRSFGRWGARA